MKSMTKLMVVAMLLVAALVVAPAAAREGWTNPTNDEVYYNITSGDTIFAGEEHLNISTLFGDGDGKAKEGRLVHFSDPSTGAADKIIEVADAHDFELIKGTVGSTTGTYYAYNKTGDAIGPVGDGRRYVVVDIPKVTFDVVLNNSRTDSVDGKSVTRDNVLAFKLQNNIAGAFPTDETYAAKMKIEVYAPGGGTLTTFGGVKLDNVRLNKSTLYVESINLTREDAGAYTAPGKVVR